MLHPDDWQLIEGALREASAQRKRAMGKWSETSNVYKEFEAEAATIDATLQRVREAQRGSGQWMPVAGLVFVQPSPGALFRFTDTRCELVDGDSGENYPNDYRLCQWTPAPPQAARPICAKCNDHLEAPSYCDICYDTAVSAWREAEAQLALPQGTELPAPDSPGWWAWEGYYDFGDGDVDENDIQQQVCEVVNGNTNIMWVYIANGTAHRVKSMIGTWTRIHLPWEVQPRPAQEGDDAS